MLYRPLDPEGPFFYDWEIRNALCVQANSSQTSFEGAVGLYPFAVFRKER